MVKHFLNLESLSQQTISKIISQSILFKKKKSYQNNLLKNQQLGLFFTKNSTRTRASFEVGIKQLGGGNTFFSSNDSQFSRGESILDSLKVLERYFDALIIRNNDYKIIKDFSKVAKIPLVNALTDFNHPCQVLADYLTILGKKPSLEKLKIVYLGDGNNVANSLAMLAQKMKLNLTIASPKKYQCTKEIINKCPRVHFNSDPQKAIKGADVIYTDTWDSMGKDQQKNNQQKKKIFQPFQVNSKLTRLAKKDYLFLHCLPAYREKEVTSEIIDGPHSGVFDQAENRLPTQKAILQYIFN